MAISFGARAVLYAPYGLYLLVILMKAIGFPFIFIVGAYVSHTPLPAFQSSMVALVGPLMNLILWFATTQAIKSGKLKGKQLYLAIPFARINLFLGIFNMIPIPGFDGFNFLQGLFSAIF